MTRHETGKVFSKGNNISLGAAGIGDDGLRPLQ